ncbi:MAG: alpha/beta hydrolase, partial [Patescibacteria group bacterium]|nr:alpha/beta hydrolase [Patescibacteria group bacterium]MDE2172864.1 alpha/beta hydrolase [Patescibacteria group bacterium]
MTQIIFIHGGSTYDSYDAYLEDLKAETFTADDFAALTRKRWRDGLQEALGPDYAVIKPIMPCAANAKYLEWKIYFDKLVPFMRDGVIFVGHSLGGIFLAKYISEAEFPKDIGSVFLVAAPYATGPADKIVDFMLDGKLARLAELGPKVHLYHSKDDPVVNFGDLAKYQRLLPRAESRVCADKGHFLLEDFPGIVADIRDSEVRPR